MSFGQSGIGFRLAPAWDDLYPSQVAPPYSFRHRRGYRRARLSGVQLPPLARPFRGLSFAAPQHMGAANRRSGTHCITVSAHSDAFLPSPGWERARLSGPYGPFPREEIFFQRWRGTYSTIRVPSSERIGEPCTRKERSRRLTTSLEPPVYSIVPPCMAMGRLHKRYPFIQSPQCRAWTTVHVRHSG